MCRQFKSISCYKNRSQNNVPENKVTKLLVKQPYLLSLVIVRVGQDDDGIRMQVPIT